MEHDETKPSSVMPEPIDVRDGLENQRQRALVEAALFGEAAVPVKIDRFTVIRPLGAGGMGVVYVAYDEQLDRRVAVKLLREAGEHDEEAQLRLQREAQAMARLAHPNVVAVHEVGTFEGQVFVAMEFVAGSDLRAWLRAEPRRWPQVLDCFVQAGEGLAAAHAAGLVHRDFKPDNVLVGDDGRVRVADFGLAQGHGTSPSTRPDASASGRLATPLTATGAILGTPAYMAPEQVRGEPTDAQTDQFGFCVALYEGLFGRRPFGGSTLAALGAAIEAGEIGEAPEGSDVPGWVRAAILRGLAPDPSARWPSMRELLVALTRDPEARRRRLVRGLSLALVLLTVVMGTGWLAADGLRREARLRFMSGLTDQLLEFERELQTRRARDEAQRAKDSARMSAVDRIQGLAPRTAEDPTVAAALLLDVEGEAREASRWISQANVTLGQPLSHAVLTEHRDLVIGLVFGPGEPVLYSGSADGSVRRWSLADSSSGELVAQHDKGVTGVALDPEGRTLAWGCEDHRVGLWSTDGTTAARMLTGHGGPVRAVAFSPRGDRMVSASEDGTARVWSVADGTSVVLRGHGAALTMAVFDADGARVATTSKDDTVRVWDPGDGRLLTTLSGHENDVFHVRFAGRDRLVSAADDQTARLWTLEGTALVSSEVVTRHHSAITSLDVQGDRLLTTDLEGLARVRDMGKGEEVLLRGHTKGVWSGLLTPDATRVVTVGLDDDVRVHAVDGGGESEVLRGHRLPVMSAAIHHAGRWLATGSFDGTIRVWDLERPRTQWRLPGHRDRVWTAAIDDSGRRLATASHDGTARLWSLERGALLAVLEPEGAQDDPLNSIAFAPDGRTLVTGSSRGVVREWDLASGRDRVWPGHAKAVWHLAFDARGERLASVSFDGTTRIWDVARGETLHVLRGGDPPTIPAAVSRAGWSRDGAVLYTSGHDGVLRVWDARTGEPRATRAAHDDRILEMVLGPDGRTLATASKDHRARLWPDPEHGEPVELVGHDNTVLSIAWSRDGGRVVTASSDATARVWDAHDGRLLATLSGGGGEVWSARFSEDGHQVFTGSEDGKLRGWSPSEVDGPIVEWTHGGAVLGLWLDPPGDRLISVSADHTARIWGLAGLDAVPARLRERLREATKYCIPAQQRMRELGEDEVEAAAAMARCRAL